MARPDQAQVLRVFLEIARLPVSERQGALTRACGGDAALRAEVEAMLLAAEQAAGLLRPATAGAGDGPTTAIPAAAVDSVSREHEGQVIGRYKLLQPIGEGGFGSVWMAEQREPVRRRVALKIIKLGMDTRQVIARFEAERQALAMMDHHSIAKVLDAGETDSGRPYFVMEYIRGVPILEYCDTHRLDTKARLRLFVSVCNAIQHAHQKGIIHRDIKPSNVLVTMHDGVPVPKVIDFGIAKATSSRLTERTLFTERRQMIGTPAYMSPEQAEMSGLDIDTRSDIYSLGVLLYELLTGTTPFSTEELLSRGFAEMMRIIREVEPPKPSKRLSSAGPTGTRSAQQRHAGDLRKLGLILRGDLDWIVMKCLEKDRTRRYETANGLAMDIQRHLADEPVSAGPPSRGYTIWKFVRRHRGQVIAAGVAVSVLTLGIIGTTWGFFNAARRAEGERLARVDAERQRAVAEMKTGEAEAERARAVRAGETIELNAYFGNVEMSAASLDYGRFDRVRERLDACPERLRNWEWRWLNAAADRSLAELRGHLREVNAAEFSPDGTRAVTASDDDTARVWDAATGKTVAVLGGHSGPVLAAAFSPDGARVATASCDFTARVWDARTGAAIAVLDGHKDCIPAVAFSPDGRQIVTASWDGTARVWDSATGAAVAELIGHEGALNVAALSPDGRRVVTASGDGTARVWDAATGDTIAQLKGHRGVVQSCAFNPEGSRIVTASWDNTARVWDAATGATIAELVGHLDRVIVAAFSPDGTRVLTTSWDDTARVWDAATGAPIGDLKRRLPWFRAQFSPEGSRIVTASDDQIVRIWNAGTGLPMTELKGHRGLVSAVSFSRDGTKVVTASNDGTARVWDAATGPSIAELKGHRDQLTGAAFSPDGTRIVTASVDATARVWDAVTGAAVAELKGHTESVLMAAFSPDGRRVVTVSEDGTARVWDATIGVTIAELRRNERLRKEWRDPIDGAAFSLDGKRVVAVSRYGSGGVWDATTGDRITDWMGPGSTKVLSFSGEKVVTVSFNGTTRVWDGTAGITIGESEDAARRTTAAALSPDGTRVVTASLDGTARVWDGTTGAAISGLRESVGSSPLLAFSPDGARIVTTSLGGTARLWDAATGVPTAELKGDTRAVNRVAFSPDGSRVVTASSGGTARVWDAVTGVMVLELKGRTTSAAAVAFSPDGTRMIVAGDTTAQVWDSVPYRERFPEIERARAALAKVAPIVRARLRTGESIDALRAALGSDPALTPAERTAAQIEIQALVDSTQPPAGRAEAQGNED